MDQVVERGRHRVVIFRVVTILHDDERRGGACDILRGNVDGNGRSVRHDLARFVARDALVDLAVCRFHREPVDAPLRGVRVRNEIGRHREGRPQRHVAVVEHVRPGGRPSPRPRCAAIGIVRHAQQCSEDHGPANRLRQGSGVSRRSAFGAEAEAGLYVSHVSPHHNDGLRGRRLPRRSAAIERFHAKQISPGWNILQRNAASVAESLPFGGAGVAICQHLARGKRVSPRLVDQPRRHVNLGSLLRRRVVVDLGHPCQGFRLIERAAARRRRAEELFRNRVTLRSKDVGCGTRER